MNNHKETNEEVELVRELEEKCNLSGLAGKKMTENNSLDNTEEFEDAVPSEPENGRISGGSNESAFSSSAGFCSGSEDVSQSSLNELANTTSSSSSGRSSVNKENQPLTSEIKLLNPNCNIVPARAEAREIIEKVRVRILNELNDAKQQSSEEPLYDELDLEEFKKPLPNHNELEKSLAFRMMSRYLHFAIILNKDDDETDDSFEKKIEKDITHAVDSTKELLKMRQQYQICHTKPDTFAKEFYILSGIFPFGHDKNHTPVLYVRAYAHRRWSHKVDESFRRYVVWQINQITKTYSDAKVNKTVGFTGIEKDGSFGLCFDCINVSYACLDMDFLRFLVKVLVNYYPSYCRYALCVDLPWLFRSVWKLVKSWLPVESQNTVQLITGKQLLEYIDEDQIPNSIRINSMKASEKPIMNKHKLPQNWEAISGIEEFAKDLNIGNNEMKQFKSHVEKIRKEYEQLGAV